MDIDIALVHYYVELITESGEVYEIDNAIQSLAWEEQEGQLAQKATIGLAADCKVEGDNIRCLLKMNRFIRIYGSWGAERQILFEGSIWEWQYNHSQNKELSIVAYDPMIRLQQSKDFKYFSAGLTTPAILESICSDWGISLDYKWEQQIIHEKKVFNGEAISDMIIRLLNEVKQQTGNRYVAFYKEGKLQVTAYGMNTEMYIFEEKSTISTTNKLSMNNLVTRVKIIGKADDDGRSSVEAMIDGNLEFGVLQEVICRDDDKSIEKANAEAQQTLKEKGQPEENIMITAPDLPFLRKGDAVEMAAGNLLGIFYIMGISHNATIKQMTMTLMRQPIVT